ncbi:MAG: ATP-binding protein [Candidatus Micrarchaeota archaeon]
MAGITADEILGYSPLNTGGAEPVPKFERKLAAEIYSFVSKKKRFVVAVDGLRRVGKSVLLKQTLNRLQKEGCNVFYFSFDKRAHQNAGVLEDVIGYFLRKDASCVMCLDEIGKVDDWAGVVKKHYDSSNATFFVSSSAALRVRQGKESLAGRMLNYTLPPLGFDEYLDLVGVGRGRRALDFSRPELRLAFREHLDGFFNRGSYPELSGVEDAGVVKNYIKNSTVEKMIFEDIPQTFKVQHVSKLLEIFEYFANYSGDFIHERTISSAVGLSEPTVNDYVTYLEQSHLVKRIYTESNFLKGIRKKKKGFVASPSIYSNTTSNFSQGKLVETAVFDKLRQYSPLTYYDEQKREVDFVVRTKNGVYPIEVKSSGKVTLSDLPSLLHYLEKRRLERGYVVYDGPFDVLSAQEKTIYLLPLSSFLAADSISF